MAVDELKTFLASCAYLAGILTSVAFGVYPMVLPARNPMYSLTVASAKAGAYGLRIGLIWWTIGTLRASGYFTFVYRSFAGRHEVRKDLSTAIPGDPQDQEALRRRECLGISSR